MNTLPLHVRNFNQKLKSFLYSAIFAIPIVLTVLIVSDSVEKIWLALLHYVVFVTAQAIGIFISDRLSFSFLTLSSPEVLLKSSVLLGCLLRLINFLVPVLSVWFGWYSTAAIIIIWLIFYFWRGFKGKREFEKLLSNVGTRNSLDPDGVWIIAVSRRFHLADVDALYYNKVLPILSKYGIVLECLYADNSSDSADYWATRMGLILELADIHILMEHFPSTATLHEQDYSDVLQTRRRRNGSLTQLLLGADVDRENQIDRYMPLPAAIRLTPKRSFVINSRKLYLPLNAKNKKFELTLIQALDMTTKSLNTVYTQIEFRESIAKSIASSYLERKYLAVQMQSKETAQKIIIDLLQKINDTAEDNSTAVKRLLLSKNKYYEFLLRIRANEKVIPRNYLESHKLIKALLLDRELEVLAFSDLDGIDEAFTKPSSWLQRFINVALHPYVIWLRIVRWKSIMD